MPDPLSATRFLDMGNVKQGFFLKEFLRRRTYYFRRRITCNFATLTCHLILPQFCFDREASQTWAGQRVDQAVDGQATAYSLFKF